MHFFVKTQNPRPTFHLDMTEEERSIMEKHVAYWSEYARQGIAVAFGPVMDPRGVYGIGIYRADNEEVMQDLLAKDPAAGLLRYDVCPMPRLVLGAGPGA